LRRIKELQERGRTILFVSHDAAAVRALCGRAILLNAGIVVTDGRPADVLNRYQKIIMAREEAYDAKTINRESSEDRVDETLPPLRYTYRHGDESAEILAVELTDQGGHRVEIIETGEAVRLRVVTRFNRDVDEPVIGFLIRNRHGIHAYGTNTKEQQLEFGLVKAGEGLEVNFSLNCWLGVDQYSIGFAIHSREGQAYDWIDGAIFFRVTSMSLTEGVANLNASVTARRRIDDRQTKQSESVDVNTTHESVRYG
jgi:hypothetical protein